jgi:hypothetical protein
MGQLVLLNFPNNTFYKKLYGRPEIVNADILI